MSPAKRLGLAAGVAALLAGVFLFKSCQAPAPPPDIEGIESHAAGLGLEVRRNPDYDGPSLLIREPGTPHYVGPAGVLYLVLCSDSKTAASRAGVRENVPCGSSGRYYYEGDLTMLPRVLP